MKRVIGLMLIASMFVATVSFAQQPQPPQMPGGPGPHQPPTQGGMMCPMMGGGTMGGGMMGGGMMGDGGMPMMGMMGGSPGESARMMQMRGEMMKAMGDIMIKYGKTMESAK